MQPIQLIAKNNHQFQVLPQAIGHILKLQKDFQVFTIIGPYRSGKSSLLNSLLHRNTFSTLSTTQAHTKGLWLYHLHTQQKDLLVIDCQGTGSIQGNANDDLNLCVLAILLSTTLIYNSVGVIDQNSLQYLFLVCKEVQRMNGQKLMPRLMWVLRDFSLQLVDKQNKQITQNQYFQLCLAETEQVNHKNQLRKFFKKTFKQRVLKTLVRPLLNQQSLLDLSKANGQIRPQFLSGIDQIRSFLLSPSSSYSSSSKFVQYIRNIIEQISKSSINLNNLWQLVQQSSLQELLLECHNFLQQRCKKLGLGIGRIKMQEQIEKIKVQVKQKWSKKKNCKQYKQLKKYMTILLKQASYKNQQHSYKSIQQSLASQFMEIQSKINLHKFSTFYQFKTQVNLFKRCKLYSSQFKEVIYKFLFEKVLEMGQKLYQQKKKELQQKCQVIGRQNKVSKQLAQKQVYNLRSKLMQLQRQDSKRKQDCFKQIQKHKSQLQLSQHKAVFYQNAYNQNNQKITGLEDQISQLRQSLQGKLIDKDYLLKAKSVQLGQTQQKVKQLELKLERERYQSGGCQQQKAKVRWLEQKVQRLQEDVKLKLQKQKFLQRRQQQKQHMFENRMYQLQRQKQQFCQLLRNQQQRIHQNQLFYERQMKELRKEYQNTKQSYKATIQTLRDGSQFLQNLQIFNSNKRQISDRNSQFTSFRKTYSQEQIKAILEQNQTLRQSYDGLLSQYNRTQKYMVKDSSCSQFKKRHRQKQNRFYNN